MSEDAGNRVRRAKRLYVKPALKTFGSVKQLTQAGTIGAAEGKSGHTDKKP